ncbi:MAG: hypothetical protein ACP5E4_02580 [Candidatus Aenigmatarchaeota archaeon]
MKMKRNASLLADKYTVETDGATATVNLLLRRIYAQFSFQGAQAMSRLFSARQIVES